MAMIRRKYNTYNLESFSSGYLVMYIGGIHCEVYGVIRMCNKNSRSHCDPLPLARGPFKGHRDLSLAIPDQDLPNEPVFA
jgi:hypothetical protein